MLNGNGPTVGRRWFDSNVNALDMCGVLPLLFCVNVFAKNWNLRNLINRSCYNINISQLLTVLV